MELTYALDKLSHGTYEYLRNIGAAEKIMVLIATHILLMKPIAAQEQERGYFGPFKRRQQQSSTKIPKYEISCISLIKEM